MSRSKEANTQNDEILLGIDYGETNIGLAFGRAGLATPLRVINAKNRDSAINEIVTYTLENRVNRIIVGLPLTADKKETAESQKVRHFTKHLQLRLNKPVEFVNEYLSSVEALSSAIEQGVPQKRRRSIDHLSAAVILKKYYDEQ